jgi:two-component system cell cycle response regulator DivK
MLNGKAAPSRTSPQVRVLVVDDFPDGLDMVAEYLTFRGFAVETAATGAEAVTTARRVKPDIVLMDLSMPDIDGWAATRMLKADPDTAAIVVIAVTAHALDREVARAFQAGCDAVISKPFNVTTLADALPRVIKQGTTALDVPGLVLSPSRLASRHRPRSDSGS